MVIDVSRLVGRFLQKRLPTGVDRVDIEYLRVYGADAQALIRYHGRWLFCSLNDSQRMYEALIHSHFSRRWVIIGIVLKAYYLSFLYTPPKGSLLFNLSHSGLHQFAYEEKVQRYGLKLIVFIHDLIPITHPEYARPDGYVLHTRRIKTALSCAKGVIVNSQNTLENLTKYGQTHAMSLPPVVVAYLASAPLVFPKKVNDESLGTLLANTPYFVMLGTIEPRKNHWLILHIWRALTEEMGELTPRLVIIGHRGWECENIIDLLERCMAIRPYVMEIPRCSDEELVNYLRFSRALLFPSFVEGYGLPLAEALSLKVPVIASNLAVFYEIAGEIPEYIDCLDGVVWKDTIKNYTHADSMMRHNQILRMQSCILPTWDTHFRIVDTLIASIELI